MNFVKVDIKWIRQNYNGAKVVILQEIEGQKRYLPIVISSDVADAIEVIRQNIELPRPITHDIFMSLAEKVGVSFSSVLMVTLQNDTHYARIVFEHDGNKDDIDCRPSDALAIAVRANIPIFVSEDVLEEAGLPITHFSEYDT